MAIINNVNEVLHRIRVHLYPNYLPGVQGAYIARTDNEASLGIEEVCAALKNRGGFTGNYDDLVEHVRQFFDETAYQLCDGFAVNTGYYSVHPNIGGTFDKVHEGHDEAKHPVTFRFRTRSPLRALAEHIVIDVEGLADVTGYVDEFVDVSTEAVNESATPGGQFSLSGHKIKVAGTDSKVGVYFVPESDPAAKVKVTEHLAENTAARVIGIIPGLPAGKYKAAIVTQWTTGAALLKEPRTIESPWTLTVA
ncbi:MAG: DUF4469 domain-containing protein [Treponema sp.]|jgi:hypothetical protein|nr:DUF4469 domain-containing protein [Treponema sp.]